MKTKLRIILSIAVLLLTLTLAVSPAIASGPIGGFESVDTLPFTLDCKSAVLMEAKTGRVICAMNENEPLPPASVTKIMTALLCMEEITAGRLSLDDTVTASHNATKMGGSQIFLKEGEQMSVNDMLKSVMIASANDASLALAEHISGSEEAFVKRMNERARELGMTATNFENTNGLDDTTVNHVTSAMDIAIMSRELLKHPKVLEYSSTWMDTIRNGEFGLTNTNRLVRFYKGATGLKTGSTSKAGFCISATAMRDGMHLIAVIMGAPSRDVRNECAKSLLDFGFATYSLYSSPKFTHDGIKVVGGVSDTCNVYADDLYALIPRGRADSVKISATLPESLPAPTKQGDSVGELTFTLDGKEIGRAQIYASEDIERISFLEVLLRMIMRVLMLA